MRELILNTDFPELELFRRGKVRDVYDIGDRLLLVATDRLSAFDVVLPDGIPGKGEVLTRISVFWFSQMTDIVLNHLEATDVSVFPEVLQKYASILEGRSMLVKKTRPLPVECIVRGYLSGSGWKEYQKTGSVCGIRLPEGLVESARLEEPIFTPSTKAEEGHDINIPFSEVERVLGVSLAERLKDTSLRIYSRAREIAEQKGIIIADTKFEFGLHGDEFMIIDEILTPDSSRFWSAKDYAPGRSQDSYDKQIVRDYLLTLDWNKTYPGPGLPESIVQKTAMRYREILAIIAGGQ